jgi:RNA polymerase sigma factor (sigma-70 family)
VVVVPSRGRASRIEGNTAPEAEVTRGLYEQYANQIFRYCLHQLGSREEAEDAVQSTFLNAFRGIKRGVQPELESAWLFKIAHNVCLSRRRSSWRRGRIESPADFEIVEEQTPAPSRRADELIGLQEALGQMPETQRRAILLREWQGLSYREIADELELSQAAVETLIFRARRALATGLEQPPIANRRMARAFDGGNLIAGAKSLIIGGSAAAKVAATVAAVSTTVVATEPVVTHYRSHHPSASSARGVLPHAKVEKHEKQKTKAATRPAAPANHAGRVIVAAVVPRASHPVVAVPKRHSVTRHLAHTRATRPVPLPAPLPVHDTTAPDTLAVQPVVEQTPVIETDYSRSRTDRRASDSGSRSYGGDRRTLYSAGESQSYDRTRDGTDTNRYGDGASDYSDRSDSVPGAPAADTPSSTPQSDWRTRHRWWRRSDASTTATSSSTSGDRWEAHRSSGTSWRTDDRQGDSHHTWDGDTRHTWDHAY